MGRNSRLNLSENVLALISVHFLVLFLIARSKNEFLNLILLDLFIIFNILIK